MHFFRFLLFKKRFVLLAIALTVSWFGLAAAVQSQSVENSNLQPKPTSEAPAVPSGISSMGNQLLSPTGGVIAFCVLGMFFLGNSNGNNKNKLAQGHWATAKEIAAARKKAREQINRRERNKTSLFIVSPQLIIPQELVSRPGVATPNLELPAKGDKPKVIQIKKSERTFWLPDCNRGVAVLGGTGSGKTYGVIEPAIRSAIDQGFPIILYDYKYAEQSSRIAGIAAEAGYKVSIFAPSFPESGICNPLDFIRDAADVDMARQVAIVSIVILSLVGKVVKILFSLIAATS